MATLKYWQAINEAIAEEMDRDQSVVLFGEDVARAGGTYVATKGLLDRFGGERVRDTPISEAALMGMATGAAMTGLRPIVEIMFFDFLTLATDQLINHAAKVSWVSGGKFQVPMVVRTICGARRNSGPQHSQNLESWLAHVPGIKIVLPSNAADMKGLLKAAVRDPNPVVVIESLAMWNVKAEVPEGDHIVPIGKAHVAQAGDDATIVSWGATVPRALAAAELLAADHAVSAEVIDLRSLSPLDEETILTSLAKTGRLVIVHDAVGPYGGGAEIAAIAASAGFGSLQAPVRRVTAPFGLVPFPPALEDAFFPQTAEIIDAVLDVLADEYISMAKRPSLSTKTYGRGRDD